MQAPNIAMNYGMGGLLAVIAVIMILILWNIQRDHTNRVDLKDLICTNGELDDGKFFRLSAWLVSTWGFVYLILDQRFSEWYFTGYMAAWVGNALFAKYLDSKSAPGRSHAPPPPVIKPGSDAS